MISTVDLLFFFFSELVINISFVVQISALDFSYGLYSCDLL